MLLLRMTAGRAVRRRQQQCGCRGLASSSSSSSDYCVSLVKRRDYEGFLCTLLLPSSRLRRAAFALRAFNAEVAGVRDAVSERTIGQMRLQFWADAVEDVSTGRPAPDQPVARELARATAEHGLSKELLLRMVESRRTFLNDRPYGNLEELDKYGHEAFSSLNYLLLECLNSGNGSKDGGESAKAAGHARHAANQLGMAQGVVTTLRATAHNAVRGRVLLPADLMAEHGVAAGAVARGQKSEGLATVVEAVAAQAESHLENCRFRRRYLTREQRTLLLPAVAADSFLTLLHRAGCDAFHPSLTKRNSWLPVLLYYHKLKGTY